MLGIGVVLLIGIGVWYLLPHILGSIKHSPEGSGSMTQASTTQATTTDPSVFTNDSLGFSFAVPKGFHVQKTTDDSGETVLMQSSDSSHGVQVYITPFTDAVSSITKTRVEREAKLAVANDSPLTVAGVGHGLQFDSTNDTPPTRQAWFVYNDYLYQASSWASDVNLLQAVLASWQFKS